MRSTFEHTKQEPGARSQEVRFCLVYPVDLSLCVENGPAPASLDQRAEVPKFGVSGESAIGASYAQFPSKLHSSAHQLPFCWLI